MSAKRELPRVREMDTGMVHYCGYDTQDGVTLCNISDWLGTSGVETTDPVTCIGCNGIVAYIHRHARPT